MSLASRMYHGETSYDFVGRRRLWFSISAVLVLISLVSLIVPGLNFGIDFKGGAVFRVEPTKRVTEAAIRDRVGSEMCIRDRVKGFAFTLGLATLIDFFAAWFFARPAVSLLTRTRLFQEGRFVGIRAAV